MIALTVMSLRGFRFPAAAWKLSPFSGVWGMIDVVRIKEGLMATITLTALLHQEVDVYVATCPEVGTVSQVGTIEEALVNLREATELYLEEFPLSRVSRPLLTTFEAVVEDTVYA